MLGARSARPEQGGSFGVRAELGDPGVEALLRAAIRLGKTPLPAAGRGHTVVKSISTRQRPRRPVSK
jgi:hypothetical protein